MLIVLAVSLRAAEDPSSDKFESVKKRYASAKMIDLGVDIIVVSDVFDDVDTSQGRILITDDGRYFAGLENDIYLFDGRCIWEYSAENNQATKKCLKENQGFESRLIFVKNLDQHYATSVVKADSVYHLSRLDDSDDSLPDSLTVYLGRNGLSSVEYYDLNGDLNRVRVVYETVMDFISEEFFEINLPDSVEIISLP